MKYMLFLALASNSLASYKQANPFQRMILWDEQHWGNGAVGWAVSDLKRVMQSLTLPVHACQSDFL